MSAVLLAIAVIPLGVGHNAQRHQLVYKGNSRGMKVKGDGLIINGIGLFERA